MTTAGCTDGALAGRARWAVNSFESTVKRMSIGLTVSA